MNAYRYRVAWSREDDCYLGWCDEFSIVRAHSDSFRGALEEIRTVVGHHIDERLANREDLPPPLGDAATARTYLVGDIEREHERRKRLLSPCIKSLIETALGFVGDDLATTQIKVKLVELSAWFDCGVDCWRDGVLDKLPPTK